MVEIFNRDLVAEEMAKKKIVKMKKPEHYPLVGEIRVAEWSVNLSRQDKEYVYFQVYCRDENRDWFKLDVKCPKNKFRSVGI